MVNVPIRLHCLTLILRPHVVPGGEGDALRIRVEIESANLGGGPAYQDEGVVIALNTVLASKELRWDFTKTLRQVVPLSASLEPLEKLSIRVAWGKQRVTEEAFVLALSFDLDFVRR